jgi:hypothetical protein
VSMSNRFDFMIPVPFLLTKSRNQGMCQKRKLNRIRR